MNYWKRALSINIKIILTLILVAAIFFLSPFGRPIYKTFMLVSETAPNFPIKPLNLLTKDPRVEQIEFKLGNRDVNAALYRPAGEGKHPAIIFTLGILFSRDNPNVVKFAQALARTGYVVLVPDLPDFLTGFVWTDSIDTLIASVEYLDGQEFVNKDKIGFTGFCVGGSAAIIASENEKIAKKVNFIATISPYFDLSDLTRAALTRTDISGSEKINWRPAKLTIETVNLGFLNYINNEEEKKFLKTNLDINTNIQLDIDRYNDLSLESQIIYNFLSNTEFNKFDHYKSKLPQELQNLMVELSPSTKINNLEAKLFILNDKKDTFVPKNEGRNLVSKLPKNQVYFKEVDSFEHVNPATDLPRWAAIRQLGSLGTFLYTFIKETS
ncbi:MAG: hypothetical protein UR98_C0015G0008 [Parcubacteria group bacterium GW2011_GWA1_36_12]|nr:MAG: hypothetical protein UR98_C0015G0008 [Parcubacteria group bacterium GW2011_GWA1_36_12]